MEAGGVLAVTAAVSAFGAGIAAWASASSWARRRRAGALPTADGMRDGPFAWLLRNGIPALSGLSHAVCGTAVVGRFFSDAAAAARKAGFATTSESAASVFLVAATACFAAGALATASAAGGVAVSACAVALAATAVRSSRDRAVSAMRDEVPDAIRSMEASFRAGQSLEQTLERIAGESHGALGEPFARGCHALRTGGTASEALACLRSERAVPELAFVAIALDVQHQTGGSMSRVLDAARDMVESELELARSLRVQTAQARLSARVVCAMPFVLVAVFSLVSDGFLDPFFASAAGLALLGLAIGMQAAGIVIVRRTLRVGE